MSLEVSLLSALSHEVYNGDDSAPAGVHEKKRKGAGAGGGGSGARGDKPASGKTRYAVEALRDEFAKHTVLSPVLQSKAISHAAFVCVVYRLLACWGEAMRLSWARAGTELLHRAGPMRDPFLKPNAGGQSWIVAQAEARRALPAVLAMSKVTRYANKRYPPPADPHGLVPRITRVFHSIDHGNVGLITWDQFVGYLVTCGPYGSATDADVHRQYRPFRLEHWLYGNSFRELRQVEPCGGASRMLSVGLAAGRVGLVHPTPADTTAAPAFRFEQQYALETDSERKKKEQGPARGAARIPGLEALTYGTRDIEKALEPAKKKTYTPAPKFTLAVDADNPESRISCGTYVESYRVIIIGYTNARVRMFASETGEEVEPAPGVEARAPRLPGAPSCFCFSDSLNRLYAGSNDGSVTTLHITHKVGTLVGDIEHSIARKNHRETVTRITNAYVGGLLTCSHDGCILLVDPRSLEVLSKFTGHPRFSIVGMAFCAELSFLIACGRGYLYMWLVTVPAKPTALMDMVSPHTGNLMGVVCIPDSTWVVTADDHGAVKVWDVAHSKCVQTMDLIKDIPRTETAFGGKAKLTCLALIPGSDDITRLVVGGDRRAWCYVHEPVPPLGLTDEKGIIGFGMSPFARTIYTVSEASVKIWSPERGEMLNTTELAGGKDDVATCCQIDHTGKLYYIGYASGAICVYNSSTYELIAKREMPDTVIQICCTATHILVITAHDLAMLVCGEGKRSWHVVVVHSVPRNDPKLYARITVDYRGALLAVGFSTGYVFMFRLPRQVTEPWKSYSEVKESDTGEVRCLEVLPFYYQTSAKAAAQEANPRRSTVRGARGAVRCAGYDVRPVTYIVAVGYSEGDVALYEARAVPQIAQLVGEIKLNAGAGVSTSATSMAYDPAHRALVVGTDIGTVEVHSINSPDAPRLVKRFKAHPAPIVQVHVCWDGVVGSAGRDNTVKFWAWAAAGGVGRAACQLRQENVKAENTMAMKHIRDMAERQRALKERFREASTGIKKSMSIRKSPGQGSGLHAHRHAASLRGPRRGPSSHAPGPGGLGAAHATPEGLELNRHDSAAASPATRPAHAKAQLTEQESETRLQELLESMGDVVNLRRVPRWWYHHPQTFVSRAAATTGTVGFATAAPLLPAGVHDTATDTRLRLLLVKLVVRSRPRPTADAAPAPPVASPFALPGGLGGTPKSPPQPTVAAVAAAAAAAGKAPPPPRRPWAWVSPADLDAIEGFVGWGAAVAKVRNKDTSLRKDRSFRHYGSPHGLGQSRTSFRRRPAGGSPTTTATATDKGEGSPLAPASPDSADSMLSSEPSLPSFLSPVPYGHHRSLPIGGASIAAAAAALRVAVDPEETSPVLSPAALTPLASVSPPTPPPLAVVTPPPRRAKRKPNLQLLLPEPVGGESPGGGLGSPTLPTLSPAMATFTPRSACPVSPIARSPQSPFDAPPKWPVFRQSPDDGSAAEWPAEDGSAFAVVRRPSALEGLAQDLRRGPPSARGCPGGTSFRTLAAAETSRDRRELVALLAGPTERSKLLEDAGIPAPNAESQRRLKRALSGLIDRSKEGTACDGGSSCASSGLPSARTPRSTMHGDVRKSVSLVLPSPRFGADRSPTRTPRATSVCAGVSPQRARLLPSPRVDGSPSPAASPLSGSGRGRSPQSPRMPQRSKTTYAAVPRIELDTAARTAGGEGVPSARRARASLPAVARGADDGVLAAPGTPPQQPSPRPTVAVPAKSYEEIILQMEEHGMCDVDAESDGDSPPVLPSMVASPVPSGASLHELPVRRESTAVGLAASQSRGLSASERGGRVWRNVSNAVDAGAKLAAAATPRSPAPRSPAWRSLRSPRRNRTVSVAGSDVSLMDADRSPSMAARGRVQSRRFSAAYGFSCISRSFLRGQQASPEADADAPRRKSGTPLGDGLGGPSVFATNSSRRGSPASVGTVPQTPRRDSIDGDDTGIVAATRSPAALTAYVDRKQKLLADVSAEHLLLWGLDGPPTAKREGQLVKPSGCAGVGSFDGLCVTERTAEGAQRRDGLLHVIRGLTCESKLSRITTSVKFVARAAGALVPRRVLLAHDPELCAAAAVALPAAAAWVAVASRFLGRRFVVPDPSRVADTSTAHRDAGTGGAVVQSRPAHAPATRTLVKVEAFPAINHRGDLRKHAVVIGRRAQEVPVGDGGGGGGGRLKAGALSMLSKQKTLRRVASGAAGGGKAAAATAATQPAPGGTPLASAAPLDLTRTSSIRVADVAADGLPAAPTRRARPMTGGAMPAHLHRAMRATTPPPPRPAAGARADAPGASSKELLARAASHAKHAGVPRIRKGDFRALAAATAPGPTVL